jgi:alpha-beta hydrolase superfamily lysophospholipase
MNGAAQRTDDPREHVVLVHGLLRTPRSWVTVRRHLEREGFSTGVFAYPSLRGKFEGHGKSLAAELRRLDTGRRFARVHLVGHSLGNLVIRAALGHGRPRNLGRVSCWCRPTAARRSRAASRAARRPLSGAASSGRGGPRAPSAFPKMTRGHRGALRPRRRRASTHVPGEATISSPRCTFVMYQREVQRAIVASPHRPLPAPRDAAPRNPNCTDHDTAPDRFAFCRAIPVLRRGLAARRRAPTVCSEERPNWSAGSGRLAWVTSDDELAPCRPANARRTVVRAT